MINYACIELYLMMIYQDRTIVYNVNLRNIYNTDLCDIFGAK